MEIEELNISKIVILQSIGIKKKNRYCRLQKTGTGNYAGNRGCKGFEFKKNVKKCNKTIYLFVIHTVFEIHCLLENDDSKGRID